MPRIKRWFPGSHDINRDPEMWEFRALIGPCADAIWQEILSIADRNEGELPGRWDSYPTLLAHACHSTPTRLRLASDWLTTPRGRRLLPWVTVGSDQTARVTNHLFYHRMQEQNKIPRGNITSSLPSEPSEPSLLKDPPLTPPTPQPPAGSAKKTLDPRIKEVADRIYKADPQKFGRLVVWIKTKQKEGFKDEVIALTLQSFESYAKDVKDWYPYLDRVILRVRNHHNGQAAAWDAEKFKNDERAWLRDFLQNGIKG